MRAQGNGRLTGVISDVHFPMGPNFPVQQCGILLGEVCEKDGTPFIFCSDGDHHSKENEIVHQLILLKDWPKMIDNIVDGHKNWEAAYNFLFS